MDEQQHIVETFSEMAPRYERLMNSELNRFWGFTYEGFVSDFLDDLQTKAGDTILDIATGTAFIPAYLYRQKKPFKKIIGLDMTFQMLHNARRNIDIDSPISPFMLVCASAHDIPLKPASIDRVICCLATHHMNVDLLLSNIKRSLVPGGCAHIADAGGSNRWKNCIIRSFIKIMAFIYFLFRENFSRAVAESSAIANIHTAQEWQSLVEEKGFMNIEIKELKSKKFWAPNPLVMRIQKPKEYENDINF